MQAAQKQQAAAEKAEKERLEKEKAEKERLDREKAELAKKVPLKQIFLFDVWSCIQI